MVTYRLLELEAAIIALGHNNLSGDYEDENIDDDAVTCMSAS